MPGWIGVSNRPRKIKAIWVGVNNKPRKVTNAWIGINNRPREWYTAAAVPTQQTIRISIAPAYQSSLLNGQGVDGIIVRDGTTTTPYVSGNDLVTTKAIQAISIGYDASGAPGVAQIVLGKAVDTSIGWVQNISLETIDLTGAGDLLEGVAVQIVKENGSGSTYPMYYYQNFSIPINGTIKQISLVPENSIM